MVDAPAATPVRTRTPRWVWLIPLAVVAGPLLLRALVLEVFKIPSGAMIPTLEVGDHLFVAKTNRDGGRGDVVVFRFPENRAQDFIKRVVGVGGDRVEYLDGRVVVGGEMLPRCAVGIVEREGTRFHLEVEVGGDQAYLVMYPEPLDDRTCSVDADCPGGKVCLGKRCGTHGEGPYQVKPGEVWVSGDNRGNSHDSRSWFGGRGGGVALGDLKGRAAYYFLRGRAGDPSFTAIHGRPVLGERDAALRPALETCLTSLGR